MTLRLDARTLAVMALAAGLAGSAAADMTKEPTPGVVTSQPVPGGVVMADIAGHTLYVYDRDPSRGRSACDAACARDRPPLEAAWAAGPQGAWTIVTRDDGGRQWAWKGKPLYAYAGDHRPGDVNGEDGGFHAVMTERKFLPPGVAIWRSDFGPAFATTEGKTLYVVAELHFNPLGTKRHTGLNLGLSECNDADCAKTWRPLAAPADAQGGGEWSIVTRPNGARQWAYKDWPVFTNAADAKPGDAQGEGVTVVRSGLSGLSWEVATL